MNATAKKYLIAIGATLLVGAMAFGFFLLRGSPTSPSPQMSQETQTKKIQNAEQTGGRKCQEITNPKNPCAVENLLPYFPDETIARQASAICYLESKGNPKTQSYVDFCRDGSAFSLGLFQINVIAQQHLIPECVGVFQTTMDPAIGDVACLTKKNGICVVSDCRVMDQAKYAACKAKVIDAETNTKLAAEIWKTRGGWQDWGAYAFCKANF